MVIINVFIAQPFKIPTSSMRPTIQDDDYVVANKVLYKFRSPRPGDIVVFHTPKEKLAMVSNSPRLIKRVVAVGGDTIETRDGVVYVNGEPQEETYLDSDPLTLVRGPDGTEGDMNPVVVPKGRVFVMGDNRSNSEDSRYIGTVPVKNIIGRGEFRPLPLNRMGFFN